MKVNKGFLVSWVFSFTLFSFAAASYANTITATAGPGGNISPSGVISVADGADQTFNITPGTGVLDVLVDDVSVGAVSSYSFTNVTADHTIAASFVCSDPPVLLEYDSSYYDTATGAYAAALNASQTDVTIRLLAGTLGNDNLYFHTDNVTVRLNGGYGCGFQNDTMITKVPGSLTISGGTVIVSNLVLAAGPLCAENDPNNFPGNVETCDGVDNNCNGLVDEGLSPDNDGDGHTAIGSCTGTADDCDDNNFYNFPGNAEICDGADNNCNGVIDDGLFSADADGDGYTAIGSCGGTANDCNDNDATIHPFAQELYPNDGVDQDCNGADLVAPIEINCQNCHDTYNLPYYHGLVSPPDSTCGACHDTIVGDVMNGHYGRTVRTDGNNVTAGSVIGCTTCHDWHDIRNFDTGVYTNFVWGKVAAETGTLTCDTCHENRAASHAAGHANRIIDPNCATCHTSDTSNLGQPGSGTLASSEDVDTLHRADCMLCHAYNGTLLNPATVRQAINNGLAGQEVNCTTCHGLFANIHPQNINHTALINVGTTGCGNCHTTPPPLVDPNNPKVHDSCYTCHNTSGGLIKLATGKTLEVGGTCITCHTDPFGTIHPDTINHTAIINVGTTSCGNCHHNQPPLVDPLDPKVHNACTTCHDETGNLISRAAGKSIATGGTCKTCHTETFDVIHPDDVDHTALINVGTTMCGSCHHNQPPLVDPNDPKVHRACTLCHDSGGNLISLAVGKSMATGGDCTTCHGDHFPEHTHHYGPANDVSFNPLVDTAYSSQQPCSDCHHDYDKVNGTSVGFSTWQAIIVEHDLDGTKDGSTNTCYNCHAYDGSKSPPLAAVQNAIASGNPATCSTCHTDKAPNHDHGTPTYGKHPVHLATPGISCGSCHNTDHFPYFKSGTDGTDTNGDGLFNLQETHVCDDCHKQVWFQ